MQSSIGERIKELRDENGWSQEHLAKLLNVTSKGTICNYEKNWNCPPGKMIEKMAIVFDVTVDYLIGISDLRERYVQFMKGRQMPVFKTCDTDALINKEYSKIETYMEIPDCVNIRRGDFFGIIIDDNSIDKYHINKNDIVVIEKQQLPEAGSLCAIMAKNKLMVRKYYPEDDVITLVPDSFDENYKSVKYNKEDVKVLGVVTKAVINIPGIA